MHTHTHTYITHPMALFDNSVPSGRAEWLEAVHRRAVALLLAAHRPHTHEHTRTCTHIHYTYDCSIWQFCSQRTCWVTRSSSPTGCGTPSRCTSTAHTWTHTHMHAHTLHIRLLYLTILFPADVLSDSKQFTDGLWHSFSLHIDCMRTHTHTHVYYTSDGSIWQFCSQRTCWATRSSSPTGCGTPSRCTSTAPRSTAPSTAMSRSPRGPSTSRPTRSSTSVSRRSVIFISSSSVSRSLVIFISSGVRCRFVSSTSVSAVQLSSSLLHR